MGLDDLLAIWSEVIDFQVDLEQHNFALDLNVLEWFFFENVIKILVINDFAAVEIERISLDQLLSLHPFPVLINHGNLICEV